MLTYGIIEQTKEQDKASPSIWFGQYPEKKRERVKASKAIKREERRSRRLGVEVSKTVLDFLQKLR